MDDDRSTLAGSAGQEPSVAVREKLPVYENLNGWRGISILLVLATHWLPIGPASWRLNSTAGLLGMSLFFSLSGFLVTSTLLYHLDVRSFLIRRLARVVPLAWLYLLLVVVVVGLTVQELVALAFFYANVPPYWLTPVTEHMWSLGVEMHFYLGIALIVLLLRRRAFVLLPFLCIGITLLRVWHEQPVSIFTAYRVDEILSGAWLALCVHRSRLTDLPLRWMRPDLGRLAVRPEILVVILIATCHPSLVALNYLRPYAAALLVASTLTDEGPLWGRLLRGRTLGYIGKISYAVYVFHPFFSYGFMSSGSDVVKYAKRIPAALLTWGAAHLSTEYYERRWIAWAKRRTR